MPFLALDIGSSFLKGAVLDLETGAVEAVGREPFPDPYPGLPAGRFEVSPAAVVQAADQLLRRLHAQCPEATGVVVSTQMGGVVFADAAHQAVTPYISWRDQRASWRDSPAASTSFERFVAALGPEAAVALGKDIKPGYLPSLLFWLQEQGQLPQAAVRPLSIGDFVVSCLTRSAPRAHPTAACGAVDVARREWCQATWARLGWDHLDWPPLVELGTPVGCWHNQGRELPCYPALGDHACALAGVLLEAGELSLNISTGSQVSQLTSDFVPGNYQTRPYLDRRYLNTITHIPAGRSLNVLVDLVTELDRTRGAGGHDPWPIIARLAEEAEDTSLAVDLSFFAGPLGERGHIAGITTDNLSVGTLFRAAFRSMADNYATLAARISPQKQWTRLVFSGGLAQNLDILRRMILAVLPGDRRICPETEDTLRGLLVAALVITGRAVSVPDATQWLSTRASAFN
ncbi:MAG: FGGY family carbohydrate kinase [Pirellulales bacterium]